ncbi:MULTISPECIES: hypothetical protein [unclassified Streptomyces]|uniref:hypothetical protein n=1 Tax=unclassified Streptomyces TaxID=2593676 RepID=UPI00287739D0|nr:hypothetical protein [Streptomyces sp. BB1-1-1]WND39248.1 hypothetical protein RI578_35340 [Streptomyces sp. BB1-1-1]
MSSHTQHTKTTQAEPRQAEVQRGHTCPSCGHHVPAEIKRHKTLGIYVPEWHRGTCRNPDCAESATDRRR